jgi:single-strand DNA-binding protein
MIPDSVSIVAGSGGNGCGRAIAQRFAKDGAAVVVSDINEQGGNETVQLIQAAGGNSVFFRADVREERQVHDLIAFAEHTYGRVTTLVNNGSGPFRPNEAPEFWADTVQTERRSQNYSEQPRVRRPQHRNPGSRKNDKGDYENRTEWHRVFAWRNLSKFAKTLQKGQLVTLEGTLRYREVEDEVKRTTFKHRISEIHAISIKRLSKIEAADDPSDGTDDE